MLALLGALSSIKACHAMQPSKGVDSGDSVALDSGCEHVHNASKTAINIK
jgi:hypothetical protein